MEYKCSNCQKNLNKEGRPELIDVCYGCVEAKQPNKKFQNFIYLTNLNYVPKPKDQVIKNIT